MAQLLRERSISSEELVRAHLEQIERVNPQINAAIEVFADRAYEDNGSLVSRKKPGAVLHDAKEIAARVLRMVQDGAVVSVTGKVIKMRSDTVCIHGDTAGAVEIARDVRKALNAAGIVVAPFKSGV